MDTGTGMAGMNRLAWCDGASSCESGNRAAAMLRPAPGRRSRGGVPGGALALLLALAVLALAIPSKAQAVRAPVALLGDAPALAVPAFDPALDNPFGWLRDVESRAVALGPPCRPCAGRGRPRGRRDRLPDPRRGLPDGAPRRRPHLAQRGRRVPGQRRVRAPGLAACPGGSPEPATAGRDSRRPAERALNGGLRAPPVAVPQHPQAGSSCVSRFFDAADWLEIGRCGARIKAPATGPRGCSIADGGTP